MRKLAIVEFVTLDGVMQGLGGPDEDREGGFVHGGWSAPYADEAIARRAGEGVGQTTAYLFGRRTYEHMAAHWPHEPADNPIAASLNDTPKYVATRTLDRLDWANSRILAGDVVESVRALKAEGEGFITVLGSGVLVQTLVAADLVDTFEILMHPLVLGTGKRLFRELSHPLPLRLVDSATTTTGVVLLSYEPRADLREPVGRPAPGTRPGRLSGAAAARRCRRWQRAPTRRRSRSGRRRPGRSRRCGPARRC